MIFLYTLNHIFHSINFYLFIFPLIKYTLHNTIVLIATENLLRICIIYFRTINFSNILWNYILHNKVSTTITTKALIFQFKLHSFNFNFNLFLQCNEMQFSFVLWWSHLFHFKLHYTLVLHKFTRLKVIRWVEVLP